MTLVLVKRNGQRVNLDDTGKELGISADPAPVLPARQVRPAKKYLHSLSTVKQCLHLGKLLDKTPCGAEVYFCKKRGTCSPQESTCCGGNNTGMAFCLDCTQCEIPAGSMQSETLPAVSPFSGRRMQFNEHSLASESSGKRLNSSILPWKGGYLYAYRHHWLNATIAIVRLTADFKQDGPAVMIGLNHTESVAGREDPRLFLHRGKPHVWFTGWLGMRTTKWNKANVLYARLNDHLQTEAIFFPKIPGRASWEKNHSYFEAVGDKLFTVYSIHPVHRVLEVYCEEVKQVHETPTDIGAWNYGLLRGGASPVLHKGEYYHFFHGMLERNGKRHYSIGVYTFQAMPPFRITRFAQIPLDTADPETNPNKDPRAADVLFPGGACFVQGHWIIAMGVHDAWSELRWYSQDKVETLLKPC